MLPCSWRTEYGPSTLESWITFPKKVSGMVWVPATVGRKNSSYVAIGVSPAAS